MDHQPHGLLGHFDLYDEVVGYNAKAFECRAVDKQGQLNY